MFHDFGIDTTSVPPGVLLQQAMSKFVKEVPNFGRQLTMIESEYRRTIGGIIQGEDSGSGPVI